MNDLSPETPEEEAAFGTAGKAALLLYGAMVNQSNALSSSLIDDLKKERDSLREQVDLLMRVLFRCSDELPARSETVVVVNLTVNAISGRNENAQKRLGEMLDRLDERDSMEQLRMELFLRGR